MEIFLKLITHSPWILPLFLWTVTQSWWLSSSVRTQSDGRATTQGWPQGPLRSALLSATHRAASEDRASELLGGFVFVFAQHPSLITLYCDCFLKGWVGLGFTAFLSSSLQADSKNNCSNNLQASTTNSVQIYCSCYFHWLVKKW